MREFEKRGWRGNKELKKPRKLRTWARERPFHGRVREDCLVSFHRVPTGLPAPHARQGCRFVLPPMLLTSEPMRTQPTSQESQTPPSPVPTPILPFPPEEDTEKLGKPVPRGGVEGHSGGGRSCSHGTAELVSRLLEGSRWRVRGVRGGKPMFPEHILCAKNLTHKILLNPHRNPVR